MTRTASQIAKSNVSRSKAHERKVAQMLSEHTGESWRRRRIEGRGVEVHSFEGGGDVICISKESKFNVECKCGKSFSFNALLKSPETCEFTKWWTQACDDAVSVTRSKSFGVEPLLFFRPFPNANWVAFSANSFDKRHNLLIGKIPSFSFIYHEDLEMKYSSVRFCRWEDIVKYIPGECFYYSDKLCVDATTQSGQLEARV